MTIKEILKTAIIKLKESNIKSPHLDAEILLSETLNKKREYLFTYPEKNISFLKYLKFSYLVNRRTKNIPIAYLLKYKYFFGNKFFINKNVLVPRPETEIMVDEGVKYAIKTIDYKTSIIDIGTGSGCIIISLLKELINKKHKVKNFKFFAIDISRKALSIARKNSKAFELDDDITFLKGNLLEPLIKSLLEYQGSEILILANLPYLKPTQINNSPSIHAEPILALVAGDDGLKYYKKLLTQIQNIKNKTKSNISLLIEIDPSQIEPVKKLFKKYSIKIKKDLYGLNRIVKISF